MWVPDPLTGQLAAAHWNIRWLIKIANDGRLSAAERVGIIANFPAEGIKPVFPPEANAWLPIETAPPERLVLLYMALPDEPLGFDIGWLEDGDWMVASKDNEPAGPALPTHWWPLPSPPVEAASPESGPIQTLDDPIPPSTQPDGDDR